MGMYLSENHQDCRICPENSEGEVLGLTECPCLKGYARDHERISDMPCKYSGSNIGFTWDVWTTKLRIVPKVETCLQDCGSPFFIRVATRAQ